MTPYLQATDIIDWQQPEIQGLARQLAHGLSRDEDIARTCFEWARDNIRHSNDYQLNPVTLKASEVLEHKTGYCYAKSHLLAALLRANQIPAALCYQRLSVYDDGAPFSLHGLNAVYLKDYGWYRIDARGNKDGVNARFTPPHEQLAFALQFPEELDLPERYAKPLPSIIEVLSRYSDYRDVLENLPDIE